MNKLHVISGLIDLKKYEEVTHFIQQLNQNYKKRWSSLKSDQSPCDCRFFIRKNK
ncbi:Spo0B domain-containing protein [Enterococcus lactis]|nr:Spo0B domain-containing protein [Enterococcus lactis]